jgi:hypothetical protein
MTDHLVHHILPFNSVLMCHGDDMIRIDAEPDGWVVWRVHEETSPRDGRTCRMATRLVVIPYAHSQEPAEGEG